MFLLGTVATDFVPIDCECTMTCVHAADKRIDFAASMNILHAMRNRLPPLKSLEGFESAARLGSFAAAAAELGLSQSAISHQVRALERALDQPLFRRVHRQIVLTDAGRDFQRTVRQMIGTLRHGVDRLAPYRKPNSVILYCDQTISEYWLMPRLPALMRALPHVDLWIDSRGVEVDVERTEVDILIARESVDPDAHVGEPTDLFLSLDFQPFATPALARQACALTSPEQWRDLPLLHLEGAVGWTNWFGAQAGVAGLNAGPTFSDARGLLIAAAQGLGVALAPALFAAPAVADGALVPIGARRWPDAQRYRMFVQHDPEDAAYVLPVQRWLLNEANAGGHGDA